MTAEVVVMNPVAVALAADSAVTIAQGKIYTSAEKLFQLSLTDPVGLMVFGNANFLDVPWETLIKAYRKERGQLGRPSVQDYADDFIAFLRRRRSFFPLPAQREHAIQLVDAVFRHAANRIYSALKKKTRTAKAVSETEIKRVVGDCVSELANEVAGAKLLPGVSRRFIQDLRGTLGAQIERKRREIFQNLPMTTTTRERLRTLALDVLSRGFLGSMRSGIVVAGFGAREYMPALVHLQVEGMVENHPRLVRIGDLKISRENRAGIAPFAQDEMVYTFMEGIDPALQEAIEESAQRVFAGAAETILAEVEKRDAGFARSLRRRVTPALSALITTLINQWRTRRSQAYWGPIVDVVSALPKDELAAMAEALVNLTKFKRRVSAEEETVGGPIDVAVITKGDGFVWVKRKHYFEAALNPRTMARYRREVENALN